MIVDARSLPENMTVETDVCIVGAGVAGVTLARELIGQQFRVCLLESGGTEPDPDTQSLCRGENVGYRYYPLDNARARCFGGSSRRWHVEIGEDRVGARMKPLDEIDFEERGWVPHSGWPFDKPHLDPYYERAQSICGIDPPTYDVEDWEDPLRRPHLPLLNGRVKTTIFKFGVRDSFINDRHNEIARAENITTYLHASVIEVETNAAADTVTRLRVVCLEGSKFWVSAKLFILAAGGIETPRLLLLSNKRQKAGLGNQNDLVGRFFMEHLHFWSGIFVPSDPNVFKSAALYSNIHTVNGVPIIGKLVLSEKVLRSEELLNLCIQLIPRAIPNTTLNQLSYQRIESKGVASLRAVRSAIGRGEIPDACGKHIRNMLSDIDDIIGVLYRKARRGVGDIVDKRVPVFIFAHITEQVPNPDSRVTLAAERDILGQNLVKLNWQLSDIDILSAVRTQEIIDEELSRAGLGQLYLQMRDSTPPSDLHGGYHHMGTTRMNIDPKKGVVDQNCKVHGISNLFIAGPSVFPTGGYANPTLTIVALTVRLADYVKAVMT